MRVESFAAVAGPEARVLVLGSMPGPESLRRGQYYGFPANSFWPIMAALAGCKPWGDYEEKLKFLLTNRIALWDVARECVRPGASDSRIRQVVPNDLVAFLRHHPEVRHIFFNGRAAQKLFLKHFEQGINLPLTYLPSTSPAYAAMGFDEKLRVWRVLWKVLEH